MIVALSHWAPAPARQLARVGVGLELSPRAAYRLGPPGADPSLAVSGSRTTGRRDPGHHRGHRRGLRACLYSGGVSASSATGRPRILLVDDDPHLLVFLADRLRDDGFAVTTARNGGEALRRLDEEWADLPIIVLSAIDTGDSKADALERVAEDYITKPFHYPELRARVTRVLRRLGDR